LRWVGVTGCAERILIDTASAAQGGIGHDSPADEIWQAIGDDPVTLWTRPETTMRLADSLPKDNNSLRGIVVSGTPLDLHTHKYIADILGTVVTEVLYHPAAGCYAIRCPHSGGYHMLTDVVTLHNHPSKSITSFYNYAQPAIKLQILEGATRIDEASCSCPVNSCNIFLN